MNSSFRSRVITGLILLLLCFGVAYFITTPWWNKYNGNKIDLVNTQKKMDSLNQSLVAVRSFVESFNKYRSQVATVSLALPAEELDTAGFISGLNELARASGVVLVDLGFEDFVTDKPPQDGAILLTRVNLTATGSFLSFKDFLIRTEQHLRLMDISRVVLASDETGQLTYQITMTIYHQK